MPPTETTLTFNVAEFQLDPVAERFFDQSQQAHEPETTDAQLSRTERRAMRATFVMLGVFALALIAFLVYSRVIMPVPVELGDSRAVARGAATLN